MTAYIIAEVDVTDPERFAAYQGMALPLVERFGGKLLASSEDVAILEGERRPRKIVIVSFDTLEACRRFYDSPEYGEAIRARKGAATLNIVAVEGVA